MVLPEKTHLTPYLGGLSSGKNPNLSRSSVKVEGGRQTADCCSSHPLCEVSHHAVGPHVCELDLVATG